MARDVSKSKPEAHFRRTAVLARALSASRVYDWLQTVGFYPEPYVLPPCFIVSRHRPLGAALFTHTKGVYKPPLTELVAMQFPKSDWTDRAFGIIQPEIHTDIAQIIGRNWRAILDCLFDPALCVYSYSFPIPVNGRSIGSIGALRAGRMIYEWIEMAESDLAAEAYRYKCLFTADVKNCYPSIYTHSIPWALHGKTAARARRTDFNLVGNRLDKLFQNANDGCTNGIPIGPAVSDLIAELVLSGVDLHFSKSLKKAGLDKSVLVVRFKDDYRLLATKTDDGRTALKLLQSALREFRLELNEDKTESRQLPDGLFRPWVSAYHVANSRPRSRYDYKRFREVYLAVVAIDRMNPGTGVIDRFLADLVGRNHELRLFPRSRELDQALSLLLMLPTLRAKSLPKVLAIVEAILRSRPTTTTKRIVGAHVAEWYGELLLREPENVYQLTWLGYFMRANGLDEFLPAAIPNDPIARAMRTSRFSALGGSRHRLVFSGVKAAARSGSMLEHLDIFYKSK